MQIKLFAGSIASPGAELNSGQVPNGMETDWVHVEFATATPVTPGATYMIEVSVAGGPAFKWRGTCGTSIPAPCTSVQSPDAYSAGVSSVPTTVQDFAFRTFADVPACRVGSVPVTAGNTYVLDVQGVSSAVTWYGNPPGGIYPYDPGISNA